MKIFEETSGLQGDIQRVVQGAFGGRREEARLVDDLRAAGDLAFSLVAECEGTICGYCALSHLLSPARMLALAPVAVASEAQRRGIGTALIERGIALAREGGYAMIFVLGDPRVYQRFGFSVEAAKPFPSSYSGPYFMALRLSPAANEPAPVRYPAAFDQLG